MSCLRTALITKSRAEPVADAGAAVSAGVMVGVIVFTIDVAEVVTVAEGATHVASPRPPHAASTTISAHADST